MLRLTVLVLLLANGMYFAWSQGMLRAYGMGPVQQTEPQRLAQQIKPEALQLLTAADEANLRERQRADQTGKECLLAGPFEIAQSAPLQTALEANLPAGAWQLENVQLAERWIIYMGPFADADMLNKKKAELASLGFRAEGLMNVALEPGLSLGSFATQALATQNLNRLNLRRIRTARVVQEATAGPAVLLRLPAANSGLKDRLLALKGLLAGKPLRRCEELAQ